MGKTLMNERLKFRAWDKLNHKWFTPTHNAWQDSGYVYDIFIDLDGDVYSREMMDGKTRCATITGKYTISKNTGLRDSEGKYIYEGDIIEWEIYDRDLENPINYNEDRVVKKGVGLIYWSSDHYKIKGCKKSPSSLLYGAKKVVVGNIFENPELLKK